MTETALTYLRYKPGDGDYEDLTEDLFSAGWSHQCPTYVHRTPPCQGTCPSGHDVRGWLNIISGVDKPKGDMTWQEYAFRRMVDANPFPALMGRCCPAPCQDGCNRVNVDDFVGINSVEHYIGQWALDQGLKLEAPAVETGKKVAIVGGGPGGLSCAYQLRRMGHSPVIFEAMAKLGGMLQYGLSTHRCPREVVDAEVQRIIDMGVEVRTNTRVGKDVTVAQLEAEFDAVFWGIGAQIGKPLPFPGAEAPNVIDGLAYLQAANQGKLKYLSGRVLVIGGGDTALDCASVSRRLGDVAGIDPANRPEKVLAGEAVHGEAPADRPAGDVMIVYRRPKERAPAHIADIDDCLSEGVLWKQNLAPVEIMLDDEGRARALKVVPVDWIDNKKMIPREGEEFEIECQLIVGATGQSSDFTGFEEFDNGRGWVEADGMFRVKGKPKHFVGGDAINPDLLTTAIGHGWKAAEGIDTFIKGEEVKARLKVDVHHFNIRRGPARFEAGWTTGPNGSGGIVHNFEERAAEDIQSADRLFQGHFPYTPRHVREAKQLGEAEILGNFNERLGFLTEEQVIAEASRCMSCGLCFECDNCIVSCPQSAVHRVGVAERSLGRYVATDYTLCIGCSICADVCPTGYIAMELPESGVEEMTEYLHMKCEKCGSTRFALPANPEPDDIIRCQACGASTPYDELRTKALLRRQVMGVSLREFMATTNP